jgi:hypothetical protein
MACVSTHRRRAALAAWAFAVASLLRPEGLLLSVLAGVFLLWRTRGDRRVALEYAVVTLALVAPLFAFRLSYYGYPFPNPYYAKSGGLANWPQGLLYASLYFQAYSVLLVGVFAAVPAALRVVRGRRDATAADADSALLFAAVAALLSILYVVRVGGDFMFGRFFLPVTPFLLLLVESLLQRLPRPALRLAGGGLVVALMLFGAHIKHHTLPKKLNIAGIVDEPHFYPESRWRGVRTVARPLRECLAGTNAVLIVQGGQAGLAYYARFPVAIERYGLTDPTIAHTPIRVRGRPGHEKVASAAYIYKRRVNLRINYQAARGSPVYALIGMPEGILGEIIVYDRALMEHMKTCPGAQFLDFPLWLEADYLPRVARLSPVQLLRDWNHFQLFYFQHNADPEGLRERLRAALTARGLTNLPAAVTPPDPFQDLGAKAATP